MASREGKTTLYLNPGLMRQAKHRALDLNIKSDSAMVEQALREWLMPGPAPEPPTDRSGSLNWMLWQILESNNEDAKSAVRQNIEVFYSYIMAKKKM
jgi:hypothetical protein